jgi:hypothetical protein
LVVDCRGSLLDARSDALLHLAKTCLECSFTAFTNRISTTWHCAITILIAVSYVVFLPVIVTLRVTFAHLRRFFTSLAEHYTTT